MAQGAKAAETKGKVMAEKLLLNVNEAAELLGVGVGTLYHWVSEGRVPHVKLSARCLRFRRADLEKWISAGANGGVKGGQALWNNYRHASCVDR